MTHSRESPADGEEISRAIPLNDKISTASASNHPALTVVVVPFGGRDRLANCLGALPSRTRAGGAIEIIVPWPYGSESVIDFAARFPNVRFIESPSMAGHAALRALGCREATGNIVALTEAQCIPDADWCYAILSEHARRLASIGGVVEKYAGESAAEWAVYLADYSRYMSPIPEGPAASLSDVNVSYRRAALLAVQATWVDEFHEHVVHSALRHDGEPLWQSPALIVWHRRSVRLASLMRERFQHARAYAGTRVTTVGFATRLTLAAASAGLPVLLILRVALRVARTRRHAVQFAIALPSLAALAVAWSCGEFAGYLSKKPGELAPLSETQA